MGEVGGVFRIHTLVFTGPSDRGRGCSADRAKVDSHHNRFGFDFLGGDGTLSGTAHRAATASGNGAVII